MSVSTTLTLNDAQKSISLTLIAPLMENDPAIIQLSSALDTANAVVPLASIGMVSTTYTVTTKDARTYMVNVQAGIPFTVQLTSAAFWTQTEKVALEGLGAAMNFLILAKGLSAITVTYA
jgi:hypothetical protein